MTEKIRKIFAAAASLAFAACAFGQAPSPELLKDKSSFSKTELFESPAVFSDREANAAAIKSYEADPSAYKPEELMPVAVCYMGSGDFPKAKSLLETFLKARPDNVRALRTLGTISMLSRDFDAAKGYYEKAYKLGDEPSAVYVSTVCIMAQKPDEMLPYLPAVKKLARENLESFNIAMVYALRDPKKPDETLVKELVGAADARKLLSSATPDALSTTLRLYLGSRKLWTPSASVVPARAAALMESWPLALEIYNGILKAEPENALALRGKALVSYRVGGVMEAANLIKKARELGEEAAVLDGIELFVLSKNEDVWNMFKDGAEKAEILPQVRAGLILYAVRNENPGMFYAAALGKNSDLLYKDAQVLKLIEEGAKKFSSDARAKRVLENIEAAKK